MKKHYDHLQYIFACLLTHSKWVRIILDNVDLINDYFTIQFNDMVILRQFFKKQGKKIMSSALLGEEKRWREVLLSIPHTLLLLSLEQLKVYWHHYLESFSIRDIIPSSPVHESIAFLSFVKNTESRLLYSSIYEYEILRNTALSYQFRQDVYYSILSCSNDLAAGHIITSSRGLSAGSSYPQELLDPAQKARDDGVDEGASLCNSSQQKMVINPSFILKKFDLKISDIIQVLKQHKLIEEIHYSNHELLGFYKHPLTGIVKCITLSEFSSDFMRELAATNSVSVWVKKMTQDKNLSHKNCLAFLYKMNEMGIVLIEG